MGSPTLYQLSVRKVADKFDSFSAIDFRPRLTENMMFDVATELKLNQIAFRRKNFYKEVKVKV